MDIRRGLCAIVLFSGIAAGQALSPAWVELGDGGRAMVRIVVSAPGDCPSVQIDGRTQAMSLRLPVPDGFRPACELAIPPDVKTASVNGRPLALPQSDPARIVAFGDTGCRVKGARVQDCNDPAKWPFEQVAARSAAEKPQLMIHLGDYLYRANACPAGSEALCGGTPSGDNWDAWNADFFTPAAPLLTAVPWAFTRGNHEVCEQTWRGWFYYLDPHPWTGTCQKYPAPYLIKLGAFELAVIDSSAVAEDTADEDQIKEYTAQLKSLHPTNAWLADHHPFWGFKNDAAGGAPKLLSVPLEEAWNRSSPGGIRLILSGHVHLFEFLTFDNGWPPQLVAGEGGTDLGMPIETSVDGRPVHGASVVMSRNLHEFGYILFTKNGELWNLALKSRTGEELFHHPLPQ